MVGMPYPNPTDAELRERMAFMDSAAAKHGSQPGSGAAVAGAGGGGAPAAAPAAGSGGSGSGVSPGQQYYQDLCMKMGLPRFCPLRLVLTLLLLAIFPRMSIIALALLTGIKHQILLLHFLRSVHVHCAAQSCNAFKGIAAATTARRGGVTRHSVPLLCRR